MSQKWVYTFGNGVAEGRAGIAHIEKIMGKKFADMENPLLVSVCWLHW